MRPWQQTVRSDETVVVKTSRTPEEFRERLRDWLVTTSGDGAATISPVSSPESNGMSSESLFFEATANGETGSYVARVAPAASDVPVFSTYDLEKQYRLIALVAEHSAFRSRAPAGLASNRIRRISISRSL